MTEQPTLKQLRAQHRRDDEPYAHVPIREQLAGLAECRQEQPLSYSVRGNGCWAVTEHKQYRSSSNPMFAPQKVQGLLDHVREQANQLIHLVFPACEWEFAARR